MVSETFLAQVVETLLTPTVLSGIDGSQIQAIGLTGSHARGTATVYSDVDILVFMPPQSLPAGDTYQLHRFRDHLLSISRVTIEDKQGEMTRPEAAVRAVPGLRQMQVLYEAEPGTLQDLLQTAHNFQWQPLQQAANIFASKQVCGLAEEAHKALSGLTRGDDSTTLYASYGLVLGLSDVISVAYGLLQESENVTFRQVMAFMGDGSRWTAAFRKAAGFDQQAPVPLRGQAGLALYTETARHLHAIIEPQHQEVINNAVELIDAFISNESNS